MSEQRALPHDTAWVQAPTPERRVGEAGLVCDLASYCALDAQTGMLDELKRLRSAEADNEVLSRVNLKLTAEVEAIEVAVRKLCPLANNEGYEDEDGDAVVYRCLNEDGDAFIETESLADAVEGMVASYDRVCEAFEAAQEEKHRLTAEVERLTKEKAALRKMIEEDWTEGWWEEAPGWEDKMRAAIERELALHLAALSLPTPAPEAQR